LIATPECNQYRRRAARRLSMPQPLITSAAEDGHACESNFSQFHAVPGWTGMRSL
jgi:hypothetical protein